LIRLVRYLDRDDGKPRPGLIDEAGGLRDLSQVMDDIGPEWLAPDDVDILNSIEPRTLPAARPGKLVSPYAGGGKVFADFDAPEITQRHAVDAPTPPPPVAFRAGLAAVVGAADRRKGAWSGAFMLCLGVVGCDWAAFGPVLVCPTRRIRAHRLAGMVGADDNSAPFVLPRGALETQLKAAKRAEPGDIVLATKEVRARPTREVALAIEDFGSQRHPTPAPDV